MMIFTLHFVAHTMYIKAIFNCIFNIFIFLLIFTTNNHIENSNTAYFKEEKMLNIFKDFDLINEIDKHIDENEDIFAECKPNFIPFIIRRIWQPLIALGATTIVQILYIVVRSFLNVVVANVIDIAFLFIWLATIFFIFKEIYNSILDAKTNYYVIATDGIHMLFFDKTLQYSCILYKDIKSVVLKDSILGVGDIYIKEKTEEIPKTLIDKFMYKKNGLIGIDEADKVFEVIKAIAIQDNENIFFADSSNEEENIEYFKDVKKYDREIKYKKSSSVIEKRNREREEEENR